MPKGYKHLTYNDRLKIDTLIRFGHKVKEIAKEIGCSQNTIYNELKRGRYMHRNSDWTEEDRYNPEEAERKYREHLKEKGRGLKIGNDMKFIKYAEKMILEEKFSPAAILMKIKAEGLEFDTSICVTTFYNYIREGVFLNVELADCPMPRKNKVGRKRKVQKRASSGTSIEKRPVEIEKREEVGHWEMDSVVGPQGKSKEALLVLSERKTRMEIIEPLKNHSSAEVIKALDRLERKLGEKGFRETFKSITVDNGTEFSDWEGIERSRRNKKRRTKVYYCHPYCSSERGTNENQNKLIRRHVPKGVAFDTITRKEVKKIQGWMNNYPRALFDGKTAQDIMELEPQVEAWRYTA